MQVSFIVILVNAGYYNIYLMTAMNFSTIITICHVASQIVGYIFIFITHTHAYRCASLWLKTSNTNNIFGPT